MTDPTPDSSAGPPRFDRFVGMYASDEAPWDTGRPQGEIVRQCDEGWIRGDVLDVGCGTGENALYLAAHGCHVVGVDFVPRAVEIARGKAMERGIDVHFVVGDALAPVVRFGRFDCIVDSGVFHVFDDAERPRYVENLRRVLRDGGRLALVCFSDREPGDEGPRRVSEQELRESFAHGWRIDALVPARYEHRREPGYAEAWLLRATRTGS